MSVEVDLNSYEALKLLPELHYSSLVPSTVLPSVITFPNELES